ncbi:MULTISPECIES: peptidoglycan-binding protein [unclassified Curtobacterium]|uniref:peptidoglycan-binding protein n=1 Tax=unclassified Curtobacterium TaxID=257496 RepID=UPI000F4BCEAF|nr:MULTISPECIES: peptidoglycan-binding protein [unclassified Curtobacterium]ROP65115.1 putative peptidoglycan binding protein [Curtobacterium sp. ZW137]TCK65382.1 putative peptidoglycan binding protein [Curtobacterium sp. PhB136]
MNTRTRKRATVAGVCLVAVIAAGTGTWAIVDLPSSPPAAADDGTKERRPTTPVVKGDLTDSKVFAGTLGYGAPVGVPGAAAGTLTWLPKPGTVIHRDETLYAVDERAVRSMHGTVPLWRELQRGRKGTDVRQLNDNLAALGYDVAQDDTFGPRTQRAVRQWQKDRGQKVTGVLTANDVVFVDGDVRVASVTGKLGQPAGGDVVTVTSTKRIVTATVSQRDAERLAVGTKVDVRINGTGDPMTGEVTDVQPSAGEDSGSKVDVQVSFEPGDRQLPAAASAQIDAKGTTERDVLSVPVSALVARGDGRYAVDVVRKDGTSDRVAVDPGFIADGRVAITGEIAEGDRVVVPG